MDTTAKVNERNAAFSAMTPEEARVEIARDVIAHIRAEKIVAATGNYLCHPEDSDEYGIALRGGLTQEVLEALPKCEACAVGSVFLVAVRKFDALKPGLVSSGADDTHMRDYLGRWFSREQLALMEVAFEQSVSFADGWCGDRSVQCDPEIAEVAGDFGAEYERDDERLIAIMENVIANGGTFDPTKPATATTTP